MSRNIEHFMERYFDLVQQNREIHSQTLAYQSMQDTYMNNMITLMQTQNNQISSTRTPNNHTTGGRHRRRARFTPSVRTAFFDLGTLFNDVVVRPTRQQISHATHELLFSEINQPQNTRCPISQQDFSQNDTVTQIRHCGHIFYPNEINTWWERNVRCPVCRHDIRETHQENIHDSSNRNDIIDNTEENTRNNEDHIYNNTSQSERTSTRETVNYMNETSIPRIRTVPRTTFSRNLRATQANIDTSTSDQELTSYVNLATQLLNNFSQGDISGGIDILYTIQ